MNVEYVRVNGSRVFRGYPVSVIIKTLNLTPGRQLPYEIEVRALAALMTGFPVDRVEELEVEDCEKMLAAFLCNAVEKI